MSDHIKILAEQILFYISKGLSYEQNKDFIEALLTTNETRNRESREDNKSDGLRDFKGTSESLNIREAAYNPRLSETDF